MLGDADGLGGARLTVLSSVREERPEGVAVYNFEVEGDHTYLVEDGAAGGGQAWAWVHNQCKRPGGYMAGDVDRHGNLSPQVNRAPGHANNVGDRYVQSHHFIQDDWAAKNVVGYSRNNAAATLIESATGTPHALISAAQRMRRAQPGGWNTTLREEFDLSYREMLNAGVSPAQAKRAAKRAYKCFGSIGAFD